MALLAGGHVLGYAYWVEISGSHLGDRRSEGFFHSGGAIDAMSA